MNVSQYLQLIYFNLSRTRDCSFGVNTIHSCFQKLRPGEDLLFQKFTYAGTIAKRPDIVPEWVMGGPNEDGK